jgi:succinate dehydrogenase / fumarate reductase iron-sulfur subunit
VRRALTEQIKKITLRVLRENPARHVLRHYETFEIPPAPGMTVLAALLHAKEQMDHSLAIRFSCRMASCGSCGMKINGLPRLACYTQVSDFGDSPITIEPLDHYPIVRDLVTDFQGFFSTHRSVKPFLIRRKPVEQETFESEFAQSQGELDAFLQFSYCIKCGLCNAACPTVATDPLFTGPQALGQAYRYASDSRDEGGSSRLSVVDKKHGVWRCHFAGACSFVCPKGVDPALAIQRLRRLVVRPSRVKREGSPLMPKHGVQQ